MQKRKWSEITMENIFEQASNTIKKFLKYCVRMKPQNRLDPITLEPPVPPLFYYVQEENILYRYSAANLLGYIEDSGNIRDPLSQVSYSTTDLMRLERLCGKKLSISETRNEDKHNRDIVMFLENDIGIHYGRVFLEFDAIDVSGGIIIYDSDSWPLVIQILNEIRHVSLWHCNAVIKHLKERIKLECYRNNLSIIRNEVKHTIDDLINYVSYVFDEQHSMITHVDIYLEGLELRKNFFVFKEMLKDLEAFERRINLSTEMFYTRSRAIVRRIREGRSLRNNPMNNTPSAQNVFSPAIRAHSPLTRSRSLSNRQGAISFLPDILYHTSNSNSSSTPSHMQRGEGINTPNSVNSESTCEYEHSSDEEKEDITEHSVELPISPIITIPEPRYPG